MANPYNVLGTRAQVDDETVRKAYLDLVRRFPPERNPEEFQRIRSAYENIRDARARLRFFFFSPAQGETFEEWIEEIRCETRNKRLKLEEIRGCFRRK